MAAWLRLEEVTRGAAALAVDARRETLDVQLPRHASFAVRVHRGAVADQIALEHAVAGVLAGVIATGNEIFVEELRQR